LTSAISSGPRAANIRPDAMRKVATATPAFICPYHQFSKGKLQELGNASPLWALVSSQMHKGCSVLHMLSWQPSVLGFFPQSFLPSSSPLVCPSVSSRGVLSLRPERYIDSSMATFRISQAHSLVNHLPS
jgi:hypothetical protein